MAWIELHQSLIRHPKVLRVAQALGVTRAAVVGHMAALWCWALDAKPDGGPLTAHDLCAGAEWVGRKDFAAALEAARFVDVKEDGYWLHDWPEYAGRLIRQRSLARDRARTARAPSVQRTHTVRAQFAPTQPYPTVPNPTEPERDPDQNPPTPLRVEFWNRACKLRGLLSLNASDDALIDSWVESGVTIEAWDAVETECREWKPDRPWAAFKSAMGNRLARNDRDSTDGYAAMFVDGDPSNPRILNHGPYEHLIHRGAD